MNKCIYRRIREGLTISDHPQFCTQCGRKLQESFVYCPYCGKQPRLRPISPPRFPVNTEIHTKTSSGPPPPPPGSLTSHLWPSSRTVKDRPSTYQQLLKYYSSYSSNPRQRLQNQLRSYKERGYSTEEALKQLAVKHGIELPSIDETGKKQVSKEHQPSSRPKNMTVYDTLLDHYNTFNDNPK